MWNWCRKSVLSGARFSNQWCLCNILEDAVWNDDFLPILAGAAELIVLSAVKSVDFQSLHSNTSLPLSSHDFLSWHWVQGHPTYVKCVCSWQWLAKLSWLLFTQAHGYCPSCGASPPWGQHQIILLGDKSIAAKHISNTQTPLTKQVFS